MLEYVHYVEGETMTLTKRGTRLLQAVVLLILVGSVLVDGMLT